MELCFVHFFEALTDKDLSVDQDHSSFDYIRLDWKQSKSRDETTVTRNVYDIVLVDELRKAVYAVRSDEFIGKLSSPNVRQKYVSNLAGPEWLWISYTSHGNHSYADRSDMY